MPVVVSVAQGGTGANSSSAALSALGAAPAAAYAQANAALTAANSIVKVTSLIYPGDDTAANNIGGQTMYINGSGFASNSTVYINGNAAPSVSFISSGNLSFTTPNIANGIYPVYVINPADGATAVLIPGMVVSSEPSWVTSTSLSDVNATDAWNISLSATGDAPITYALAAGSSLPSGISLAANGVISGTLSSPPESDTTYNFTVIATDAQNQDSSRQFSITATVGEGLPFANNVLLIHADGTNNQNNHHFIDSSSNNYTITRNGNPTQGSFSPFSQTGWCVYFENSVNAQSTSGKYLTVANTSAFNIGTGDFTLEGWINPIQLPSSDAWPTNWWQHSALFGRGTPSAGDGYNLILGATKLIFQNNDGQVTNGTHNITVNKWYHVAACRSGGTLRLFVNGSVVATTSSSFTGGGGSNFYIGCETGEGAYFHGYMSNVRLLVGTALYTGTFTPSTTPLTAVSNTVVLSLQSNRHLDNSTNNYNVTPVNSPIVIPYSPFASTITYSAANVGGSVYLDGSGDYLTASNPSMSGTWTVDFWWYPITVASQQTLTSFNNGGLTGINIWCNSSAQLVVDDGSTGQSAFTSKLFIANSWNHVAIVRNGSTTTGYINGVAAGSNSFTPQTVNAISIGRYNGSPYYYASGYLSGVRVVQSAVYTTAFTPPTAPPTNIANTAFLCNFTNAGIFDQTAKNVLETVGDAKISTSVYKYGTGSLVFDGTGDRLYKDAIKDPLSDLGIGNEPFTVEQWVYFNTVSGAFSFSIGKGGGTAGWNSSSGHQYLFGIMSSGSLYVQVWNGSALSSINVSNPFSTGQWYHYAVSYDGTTTKVFVNGSQVLSGSITYAKISNPTRFVVGDTPAYDAPFNGYIDDLRVTKGSARYTSNFTPPTSALKDK